MPEQGTIQPGERVHAHVDRAARHATECNHTATHLLHAALRRRLGTHVRQAGSYVGPDKLRFDFTHGKALTPDELLDIEDQVNVWILESQPVRALTTTLDEARALGAMALFGEKYGDVVRMVEVGDGSFSRELCGGTHVREHGRDRAVQGPRREFERRQHAPDRGDHRPRGGCADASPRPRADRCREGPSRHARPRSRGGRARSARACASSSATRAGAAPGGAADVERLAAGRDRARRRPRAGDRASTGSTARRCSTSPTG